MKLMLYKSGARGSVTSPGLFHGQKTQSQPPTPTIRQGRVLGLSGWAGHIQAATLVFPTFRLKTLALLWVSSLAALRLEFTPSISSPGSQAFELGWTS